MLESRRNTLAGLAAFAGTEAAGVGQPIAPLQLASLWRHKRLIAFAVLAAVLLGVLAALIRPVTFTANARLLIDNRNLQLPNRDAVYAQSSVDLPFVQNQLELLKSEKVALKVVDDLNLASDEEFVPPRGLLSLRPRVAEGPAPASTETSAESAMDPAVRRQRTALQTLQRNLVIRRIGESYTLEVSFRSKSPTKAAAIANGIANTYMESQIAANNEAAQSATAWLRDRIRGLGPNARVITEAAPPVLPDGPRSLSLIAASAVLGMLLGSGLAFTIDLFDQRVRTPAQAGGLAQAECFGVLPTRKRDRKKPKSTSRAGSGARRLELSAAGLPLALEKTPSLFSNTLRRIRTALIHENGDLIRTVGVTSAQPREGKSTVAANIALSLAQTGKRILLVDTAAYNGELSKLLVPPSTPGLADVLGGLANVQDVIWRDETAHLDFLPIGQPEHVVQADLIWSERLNEILTGSLSGYDYIVFDLPVLAPLPDVRASAHVLDALLLVIQWGTTSQKAVEEALATSGQARSKIFGTILNNAPPAQLRRYGLSAILDGAEEKR